MKLSAGLLVLAGALGVWTPQLLQFTGQAKGENAPGLATLAKPKFEPNPKLAALPDNTALDLRQYETDQLKPEGETHAIRITDYSRFTYDSINHQLLMFGGGHASTPRTDVDVFNFRTLTWKSARSASPASTIRNQDSLRASTGEDSGLTIPFSR